MKPRNAKRALLALAALAVSVGAGSGALSASAPPADFVVSGSPSTVTVQQGATAQFTVKVAGTNGFNKAVALTVSGLPSGTSASLTNNPNHLTADSVLTVLTHTTTATGDYSLTVTGTNEKLKHTVQMVLAVAKPGFTLAVTPATASVTAGSAGTFAVTITRTLLTAPIGFSVTGVPTHAAATFTPASTTGTATSLSVTTAADTPTGSYALVIKGTSGTLTASVTAQLSVLKPPSFTLTAAPSSLSVAAGRSGTVAVTITRTNLSAPIAFTATGLPANTTATFAPGSTTGNSTTLTLQTAANTPLGAAHLLIIGNAGSAAPSSTVPVTLTVTAPPPSFTLAVAPDNLNVSAGLSGAFTVTITRTNLTAPIAFTVTGIPAHVTAVFSPVSTSGNTTTLSVTTASNTTLGSYNLVVKGTYGSLTASTTAHLSVSAGHAQGFTIAGTLDRQLSPGTTGYLNLALTNPNNTALSVTNLTVSITGTSRSGCATSNFTVLQFSGTYPLVVPANSTRTLSQLGVAQSKWAKITMINLATNQDNCKSTTLTLGYSGSGQGN